MARHLVLDIRDLEPPEPLDRVLTAIADFGHGDTLKILSNFEPTPLYRILERDGFRHHVEAGADATLRDHDLGGRVSALPELTGADDLARARVPARDASASSAPARSSAWAVSSSSRSWSSRLRRR